MSYFCPTLAFRSIRARPQINCGLISGSPLKRTAKPDERFSIHFNGFESISPQFICGWVLAEVPFAYA